jgi:hypothetical protein
MQKLLFIFLVLLQYFAGAAVKDHVQENKFDKKSKVRDPKKHASGKQKKTKAQDPKKKTFNKKKKNKVKRDHMNLMEPHELKKLHLKHSDLLKFVKAPEKNQKKSSVTVYNQQRDNVYVMEMNDDIEKILNTAIMVKSG